MSPAPSNLDTALALGAKGKKVFPCWEKESGGHARKSPRTKNGFKDATSDTVKIKGWWKRWPRALIGMPTGAINGFDVVDADPKGKQWEDENSECHESKRKQTTQRGTHYYYRHMPGIGIKTGALPKGIDVRGDGGYVIFWAAEGCPVEGADLDALGEMPRWLFNTIVAKPAPGKEAEHREALQVDNWNAILTAAPGMHDGIRNIAFALIYGGCDPHTVKQQLLAAACYDGSERTQKRIDDIDRAVDSAVDKYKRDRKTGPLLVGPLHAIASNDAIAGIPAEPDVIVEGYLFASGGGMMAPGGVGKTTLAIFEAIHIILGLDLYGLKVVRPGGVLFITAEDERGEIESRLNKICKALNVTSLELEKVRTSFYIEDISTVSARLVRVVNGELKATEFTAEIVEKYQGIGLAYCHLDPVSLLGPGEESGNDGMAELMRTARYLAKELGCAVRAVHHVGKANARDGVQDQYAGRGGSAYADNARFIHQLILVRRRVIEFEDVKFTLSQDVTDDDLQQGRITAVLVHKLSYAARDRVPIVVRRRGFLFEHMPVHRAHADIPGGHDDALTLKVVEFIRSELERGFKYNPSLLEGRFKDLGISRNTLRVIVSKALDSGAMVECNLPVAEIRGKRKTYLVPAEVQL